MKKRFTLTLTPAKANRLARHLDQVINMAEENSCSCNTDGTSKQNGYRGHTKDCWVHLFRKNLIAVQSLADLLGDGGK